MHLLKKDEIALMTVTMAKLKKALKLHPSCSYSLRVFSNSEGDNYVTSANSDILPQNCHASPSCSLSHVIFAEAESQKSLDKKGWADAGMHGDTFPRQHIPGQTPLSSHLSDLGESNS